MRYLSLGTHLLQKQKDKKIEQFWTFKNCTEDKIDLDHIHEQYGVYYISMYYMDFYKKKQPYKFIVQFLHYSICKIVLRRLYTMRIWRVWH